MFCIYSRLNSVEVGLQFQDDARCKGTADLPGLNTLRGKKTRVRLGSVETKIQHPYYYYSKHTFISKILYQ